MTTVGELTEESDLYSAQMTIGQDFPPCPPCPGVVISSWLQKRLFLVLLVPLVFLVFSIYYYELQLGMRPKRAFRPALQI